MFKKNAYIHPEFIEIVRTFEQAAGIKIDYDIKMVSDFEEHSKSLGACEINIMGNQVLINEKMWGYLTLAHRKLVLYHEMAHCSYEVDHNWAFLDDGCPATGMFWTIPRQVCIVKHGLDYYLDTIVKSKNGRPIQYIAE